VLGAGAAFKVKFAGIREPAQFIKAVGLLVLAIHREANGVPLRILASQKKSFRAKTKALPYPFP
jgi:hypothetical protein